LFHDAYLNEYARRKVVSVNV